MKKVYLVRHAKTSSNYASRYMGHIDEDLAIDHVADCEKVAYRLSTEGIRFVYAGPLKRARQTAEPLCKTLNIQMRIHDGLNEMKMGPWEGMTALEIAAQFPAEWSVWRARPHDLNIEGRETLKDVQIRSVHALSDICRETGDDTVALFTHDVIVRLLLAAALDNGPAIYRRVPSSNCSVSCVVLDKGEWRVELMNETKFLESEQEVP